MVSSTGGFNGGQGSGFPSLESSLPFDQKRAIIDHLDPEKHKSLVKISNKISGSLLRRK
jgi:hypothetical protein